MTYTFDYFYTMQPMDSYECEDISNFTLNINSDNAFEYYIDVYTELGETTIKHYGPLLMDSNEFRENFEFKYYKFQFNENKIIKLVDKLINNSKILITQVTEIDKETFNNRLKGILDANAY